jgi:hypothetical protein
MSRGFSFGESQTLECPLLNNSGQRWILASHALSAYAQSGQRVTGCQMISVWCKILPEHQACNR